MKQPSVTFKRWDVVAVDFPFVEGMESKRRPALVVSSDRLFDEQSVYWLAMITTAKATQRRDDIPVSNPLGVGLPEPCVIRLSRLMTTSENRIVRRMGSIQPKDRNAVSALLKRYAP